MWKILSCPSMWPGIINILTHKNKLNSLNNNDNFLISIDPNIEKIFFEKISFNLFGNDSIKIIIKEIIMITIKIKLTMLDIFIFVFSKNGITQLHSFIPSSDNLKLILFYNIRDNE